MENISQSQLHKANLDSNSPVIVLILCGGSGSRLWPLSDSEMPKQFAQILPGKTLFEHTVERNIPLTTNFMIAVNESQIAPAHSQMNKLGIKNFQSLVEPIARNTAPALALSAMLVDPNSIIVTVPSDHIISNERAYTEAVHKAVTCAESGNIVTFGITPSSPETGYGYIETEHSTDTQGKNELEILKVKSFREKPDTQTAEFYCRSGNYYWNSGMFCFKASVFLEELHRHSPEIYATCEQAYQSIEHPQGTNVWKPTTESMKNIPALSVDYAVMEKTKNLVVIPCEIGWSDLGSFDAVRDYYKLKAGEEQNRHSELSMDRSMNINNSAVRSIFVDSENNFVLSTSTKKQIAVIDIDNVTVVETLNSLLICKNDSGQKVKHISELLHKQ